MTERKLTPMRAIRKYCRYECSAGDTKSWKDCSFIKCPLYEFRKGRRNLYTNKTKQARKQPVLHRKPAKINTSGGGI